MKSNRISRRRRKKWKIKEVNKKKKRKSRTSPRFDQSEVTTSPPSVRWFVKSFHIFSPSVLESNNRPDYISITPLPPFIFLENNETDRQLAENGGKKGRKAAFLSRHKRSGCARIHHG